MEHWAPGYSQVQLDDAQDRYGLRFPPDLIDLLLDRRPADGYDWDREDPRIRGMLAWPLDMLMFDVEQGFWWPEWDERPSEPGQRRELVERFLVGKSRLIPLLNHRFLPESPSESGNPIFSMYGFDTVYYGSNLGEYFKNEFQGGVTVGPVRHIPFWSDIAENYDQAYRYYIASENGQDMLAKLLNAAPSQD